ncbi:MAG TPA: hypothetical protein VGC38_06500 [Pseudolabrys sp.]
MNKLSALAFLIVFASPPALAYTQEDADACTPDAFRLCSSAIPDASRVADCLVQNKRGLSQACAAVVSRPRDASVARDQAGVQKARY